MAASEDIVNLAAIGALEEAEILAGNVHARRFHAFDNPFDDVPTALRFFASGSYQLDVGGNVNHAMRMSSVSKAIQEVRSALNNPAIFNQFVKLTGNIDELRVLRNSYYENHRFPGVVGCVDCTHVAIYPPNINDNLYPEAAYVNRKGYHFINVQLIISS